MQRLRLVGNMLVEDFSQPAQMLSKMQTDLGPQGFQALSLAFNEMSSMLVRDFVRNYGATFPVAWANRDAALNYLNIPVMERFVVPQIVVIDRKGTVRWRRR